MKKYMFECDGCGEKGEHPGADMTKLPPGWAAFSVNSEMIEACSHNCAVAAVEKKLKPLFKG